MEFNWCNSDVACYSFCRCFYINSYYFAFLFLLILFLFFSISIYYIGRWSNGIKESEKLFWRLRNQNMVESLMLFFLFSFLVVIVFLFNFYEYEPQNIAIIFMLLKIFIGISTQLVSSIPRVAKYFSDLPEWPVFWSKRKWI